VIQRQIEKDKRVLTNVKNAKNNAMKILTRAPLI